MTPPAPDTSKSGSCSGHINAPRESAYAPVPGAGHTGVLPTNEQLLRFAHRVCEHPEDFAETDEPNELEGQEPKEKVPRENDEAHALTMKTKEDVDTLGEMFKWAEDYVAENAQAEARHKAWMSTIM
jgi:hypothetical protein